MAGLRPNNVPKTEKDNRIMGSYPADCHLHTYLCRHATGTPVEYAAEAARKGLSEIGFTDHSPMPQDDFDDWRMRLDQLSLYVDMVREAQARFPQLVIRLGLEVDYLPDGEAWIRELSNLYPWDYLIGSAHYIAEGWDVDNPAKKAHWHGRDRWEIWETYFDRFTRAAATGLFDVMGHPDLPKKFGYWPEQDCTPLYEKFLKEAQRQNVAIDVNTAGLRKECREIYPSAAFLSLACKFNVPIIFGSDAHDPTEVGYGFSEAIALARNAGYTEYCRFSLRQRETISLPIT